MGSIWDPLDYSQTAAVWRQAIHGCDGKVNDKSTGPIDNTNPRSLVHQLCGNDGAIEQSIAVAWCTRTTWGSKRPHTKDGYLVFTAYNSIVT